MKNRYRVFRRGWGTYYCEERSTHRIDQQAAKLSNRLQTVVFQLDTFLREKLVF